MLNVCKVGENNLFHTFVKLIQRMTSDININKTNIRMKHFFYSSVGDVRHRCKRASGGTGALLDETYQFTDDGDGLFRYVFAYDKTNNAPPGDHLLQGTQRWRVGQWSLYEVGNYSYQFDSKGSSEGEGGEVHP